MDDKRIVELFHERSEQAIKELSEKYGFVCKRLAFNILKNEADADECLNDSYLKIWNSVPPEDPDPLLTYTCKIVRNTAIHMYDVNTAQKRNSFYDSPIDELENFLFDSEGVEETLAAKELKKAIEEYLSHTDRESRFIFIRRFWFCDEIGDIAEAVGKSPRYVSLKLFRIKEDLKKYLIKKGYYV